jgi:hypothetical protein
MINNQVKGEHKFKGLNSGVQGYKNFKKRNPGTSVTRKEYATILEEYFKQARDYVLNGGEYKFPFRLGTLKTIKVKGDLKKLKVDWGETNKLWARDAKCKEAKQLVYHLNEHSGGDYYKIHWVKRNAVVKNISRVSFIAVRGKAGLKGRLPGKIKNERKDYLKR